MSEPSGKDEVKSAGRGVIWISLAKAYFMLAGAILEFRLPVLLSTATFGAYKTVTGLVSPINNVIITGTIQTLSRFTAQDPSQAEAIHGAGVRMHLRVGLPIAGAFALSSPLWARFFHDTSKTLPIAMSAAIMALYSIYATFVGRANGQRRFHQQAGLDVSFATLRVSLILLFALLGFGVVGALAGWIAAAGLIIVVAAWVVGRPVFVQGLSLPNLTRFFGSVALYLIFLNVIMVADQLLLARFSAEYFRSYAEAGQEFLSRVTPAWVGQSVGQLDHATLGDTQVGYYAAVQNLARLSYQAIIAVTFVIFPLISRTTFGQDRDATRRYVETTLRYSFVFCSALATLLMANPGELLDLPYPASFATMGWAALSVLAFGNVAFAILVIAGTILNSAGKPKLAILSAGVTLTISIALNAFFIPRSTPGADLLTVCALATSSAMVIGACISNLMLSKTLGGSLSVLTLGRVALSAAICTALGKHLQCHGIWVLLESAGLGILFLAILLGTREFTGRDLRAMLRLAKRGKRA